MTNIRGADIPVRYFGHVLIQSTVIKTISLIYTILMQIELD